MRRVELDAGEPAVSAAGLTKSFRSTTVIDDVSFRVERGTIVGFIGPSGCGKTTLVRLMTGIATPTSGEAPPVPPALDEPGASEREAEGEEEPGKGHDDGAP